MMKEYAITVLISAAILFTGSLPSNAAQVNWSLKNVEFDVNDFSGPSFVAQGTGSFVYDAAKMRVVDWDITISPLFRWGSGERRFTSEPVGCPRNPPCVSETASASPGTLPHTEEFLFQSAITDTPSGEASLKLVSTTPLTDQGGTVPLVAGVSFPLTGSWFVIGEDAPQPLVSGGLVSTTSVPESSKALLLALGLVAIAGLLSWRDQIVVHSGEVSEVI
jgi:hypothetical protein